MPDIWQGANNTNLKTDTMKTTINNSLRVFQVVTSVGHQYFCNLDDLNRVINENGLRSGYFRINHFWNNKAQRVSKKYLKELFAANQLTQEFEY